MRKRIATIALCLGLWGCSDSVYIPQDYPLEEVVDTYQSPEVVELPDTRDYPQSVRRNVYSLGYLGIKIDPVTPFIKDLKNIYSKTKP